jgi:excisionase family DNA binding protein
MNLLTINEVAIRLGLAPKTVRRWIRDGKIKAVRLGREWRVDADELALFIRRRTI